MNFTYKEGLLEKGFNRCRQYIDEGELDKARDTADYCIAVIGMERWENDAAANDKLDNVTIKVWLKRFWVDILENNNLLLA
jgi:hypothetical protein|tara:strand:- start:1557 stop:1799 length:243 start_codon:yes stop_codon:yes gene_type:complete